MKILAYLLVLSTVVGLTCAWPQKTKNVSSVVLLEIYTNASDSIYPPGRTLDLQVFDDGRAVFDDYSLTDATKQNGEQPRRMETRIKDEDLRLIRRLVAELEIESPKSSYTPTQSKSIDERVSVAVTYLVHGGMRTIDIVENDSYLHLDDPTIGYPKSLVALLKLNYEIGGSLRKHDY